MMPDIFDASAQNRPSAHEVLPEPEAEVMAQPDTLVAGEAATPDSSYQTDMTPFSPSPDTTESAPVADSPAPSKPKAREVDDYSQVMSQESPSTNPLDSFAPKPLNIFFDSQHHEEKVILLLRQHPITQIPWVITAVGMALLPFLIGYLPIIDYMPLRFQLAGLVGWFALIFSFILESFLVWFFNVYIITDERVIDVDFHSLIYKNISAAKIDNIEDITATTGGALRSVFNYGTVKIQTAGTSGEFEFENVPQPAKVTALLNELLVEEEREKIEGRVN